MQFSYGITEADYLRAWKLRCKAVSRPRTTKVIMFWVFVLVCLMMLWVTVQKGTHAPSRPAAGEEVESADDSPQSYPSPQPPDISKAIILNAGPFVLIGGIWVFMLFRLVPGKLRKLYRGDPGVQGRYTVEITSDFIAIENTAGFSSRSRWNIYEYWKEGKDLIILGLRSQAYIILGLGELSPGERDELRAILSASLAKK